MEKSQGKMAGALVALVVGAVLGVAVGFALDDGGMNESSNNSNGDSSTAVQAVNSDAANTRVALNNALREHVNLAGVALRNVYTEAPDADASVAALDENSVEVAGVVGSVYGEEAQEQFLSLWRNHIGFFADYTVAAREGDQAGMEQAKEDLAGYGKDAAAFFEGANENLPADVVQPLLEEHRDLVLATIDLIGAGDFDAAYLKLGEAADQVGTIGDALATGIVTQQSAN